MAHVLKDHEQRATLGADSKEAHDMLMLQHGQQLCLALKVLSSILGCLLQCLGVGMGMELEGTPTPIHLASFKYSHPDTMVVRRTQARSPYQDHSLTLTATSILS